MRHRALQCYKRAGPGAKRSELAGELSQEARATGAWNPIGLPSLASVASLLPLLAVLLFPVDAGAETLRSQTVTAWNEYLRTATAKFQERVQTGGSFLWTLEDTDRAAKVRAGEIVVASAPGQNPKKVPGGLIHHWIGAAFLPGQNLNDTLEVARDYDRYKEFYRPAVMDSKVIAHDDTNDKFSMLITNRVFFSKMALDADYQATHVRLDDRRFYTVSRTTRVQEIQEYGQSGEHKLPVGEGGGYIWSLYSIACFEQSEGGVYVELEAIALSRQIPAPLRFVADPIVRRVSRNSLLTSLQQTVDAVHRVTAARSAGVPITAEHAGSASGTASTQGSAFIGNH